MSVETVVFGRYRLHEQIGAGGAGVVWRATDELLHQTVALKRVTATGPDDEQAQLTLDRVLREARLAAQLRGHPHVVAVYDVLVDDGDIWLVMEYLPARSLREILDDQGPLDRSEVARIGAHIADALAAAHDRGIEHRDVKPGNVLISHDGTVKLTDFGISHLTGDPQLTQTRISGTPAFLAPEVASSGESFRASDVFSLGATLYAAVEGQPPFGTDDNVLRLINVIRTGIIRPPLQAGPLEPLLLRLLQVSPATRPDAATTRDLLTQFASQLSEPGRQKRTQPRPRRWPSRRHIAITVGTILTLVAISVIVRAVLLTHSTREALVDGGFETPQLAPYAIIMLNVGQPIGAWTVTQGNVDLLGAGTWSAAEGTQSVDLNGLVDGAIAQTFSTLPDQTYMVEFALAGNPHGPPTVKTGHASVNGQPVMDFSSDITGTNISNMGYRKMRFSFTSSGTQTTIEFASTSGTANGPVIDEVSVTPVSPP
ncbi:MAG TPA: choice-of-anchor C family protein [Pseudonocardiaceae bacterium]|nr:choice-of-anchor C family protein [Pseudonocardiaceae bacterium]